MIRSAMLIPPTNGNNICHAMPVYVLCGYHIQNTSYVFHIFNCLQLQSDINFFFSRYCCCCKFANHFFLPYRFQSFCPSFALCLPFCLLSVCVFYSISICPRVLVLVREPGGPTVPPPLPPQEPSTMVPKCTLGCPEHNLACSPDSHWDALAL